MKTAVEEKVEGRAANVAAILVTLGRMSDESIEGVNKILALHLTDDASGREEVLEVMSEQIAIGEIDKSFGKDGIMGLIVDEENGGFKVRAHYIREIIGHLLSAHVDFLAGVDNFLSLAKAGAMTK